MMEWVIVGGGPHGVHQAVRLIGEAGVDPEGIRIVDPGPRLMDTWHRCTENTGMTHLRSPSVHHLDLDPYSLKRFATSAEARQLSGKPFVRPYSRPSVALFRAHCAMVMARYGVSALHHRSRVSRATVESDGVTLTLESGEALRAKRVLLALGASGQPRLTSWSETLPEGVVHHIFQAGFTLDPDHWPDRVVVVGAGITGVQSALRLTAAGKRVTLVSRHDLRKHPFDSDPAWVGPKAMTRFSRTPDPEERRRMITGARHLGSLPPDLYRRVRQAHEMGRLELLRGEVREARPVDAGARLTVGERVLEVDSVLLATGFEPRRPGGALVDDLIEAASLPCARCGFPIVDRHLRWHPRVFVSGPLAELEIGPVARNLIGARRAAERIVAVARGSLR